MFYISCKIGSKYGIIDTEDGKTEFYTASQIESIIKNYGVSIVGFSYQLNGYSLSIAHPVKFRFDSNKEFIATGFVPTVDNTFTARAKLLGMNDDFSEMFKDVPYTGNGCNIKYPELCLVDVDFQNMRLLFRFNYDYSCGANTCKVKDIVECWNKSVFKQRTKLLFTSSGGELRWCSVPFISLQLSPEEFGYILSLVDLFYTKKPSLKTIHGNEPVQVFNNLYIQCKCRNTNVGNTDCFFLYTYIGIYKVPILSGAREGYIYGGC